MTAHDRRLAALETLWPPPPPKWAMRAARRSLAGAEAVFVRCYTEKLAREDPAPPPNTTMPP